jgi:hypothetical protein
VLPTCVGAALEGRGPAPARGQGTLL